MTSFDPVAERAFLNGDVGYRRVLNSDFETARAVGGLASSAAAFLTKAVLCLLVGYDDPARQILGRAFDWLTTAIRDDERPRNSAPYGPESERYHALALCNWMLNEVHDQASFDLYVALREKFLDASTVGRNKTEIALTLASYVDAGAYDLTLARFASAGMKPPASLGAIRSEGQMAYVIARHRLGEAYDAEEVAAALSAFLRRNVNAWLVDGHALPAAEWMKIAHWREEGSLSPKDAILKCYDYLPVAAAAPAAPD